MHPYTTHQIAEVVGGLIVPTHAPVLEIRQVTHDSRRIPKITGQLFMALHGPRHDGHTYLTAAYQAGLRAFLIDQELHHESFPGATFIQVENTNLALQKWAAFHRHLFKLPVIGITGSNGKTTVKEWLFQLLEEYYRIVRSPASYNSQVGVPLSVLQISAQDQLGIFEAGISETEEMQRLAPIIDCTIGLFTNIGTAHAAGFSDQAQKVKEKLQLFAQAEVLIYCKDHEAIAKVLQPSSLKTFCWSTQGPADLTIEDIQIAREHTAITALYQAERLTIDIPFIDQASIENAIHCWAVLLYLGIPPDRIAQRMKILKRLELRLALRAGVNHCILIDDTYNADLTALGNALNFLDQQPKHLRRSLILSDFLQSGLAPESLYQEIAKLIQTANVDQLIGIGEKVPLIAAFLPESVRTYFFPDTQTFLQEDVSRYFSNEIILLKGARSFAFDRISQSLSAQQHRTVLEVNLEVLSSNLLAFQQVLEPDTKVMVMVKAAAYGIGSLEVARRLAYLGVDYLAVAYVDEGVKLRQAGISLPILVLNPEPSAFTSLLRYELEPEIYTLNQLKELEEYLADGEDLKVHLKIDTGMHRLGFAEDDMDGIIEYVQQHRHIKVSSIFSHLAASEDSREDDFTRRQVQAFQTQYEKLSLALGYRPIRHLLNSAGIMRFPEHQMEMVRLGIGLYGVLGVDDHSAGLQPVLTLKATVSQLKWLEPGDTVGYGRVGKLTRRTRLATISIGYADGVPRKIDPRLYQVYIHGQPAPILGRVCMDMCMVDVTDIPKVQYKDEVVIFGDKPSVEDLAAASDRIVYEILTAISTRVQRLYTS
ncbi:MAG: bifunctional UDP-N-acetylmuramoyl-tripeptide:D-alanyl-D-alanine ligase/alanine racemase [Saprospiraceae bacterium]|nr:bifunctional UDP-N-acetylmuramoyl-tripeptide:D-alanyl-D-alanine ligase/alanine racemase [Saprospiraceae bacterium]